MLNPSKKKDPFIGINVNSETDNYLRLYSIAYNLNKSQAVREAIEWWMRQKPDETQVVIDLRKRILNLYNIECKQKGIPPKTFLENIRKELNKKIPAEYVYKVLSNLIS